MSNLLKELQEKRLNKYTEVKELADKQATWTAEDRTKWDAVNAEYDAICAEAKTEDEKLKSSEAVQKRLQEMEAENRASSGDRRIGLDHKDRREDNPEFRVAKTEETRALALQGWLRAGKGLELTQEQRDSCRAMKINPASPEMGFDEKFVYGQRSWSHGGRQAIREFRTGLDVATSGKGQTTIPQGFMAELERFTLEYAHVRAVCRVIHTATGNALPWPTLDDTSNTGVLLSEATTIGTSVDPSFSSVTFNAYKMSSKPVFASAEILEDSAFNLASEIASMLGERHGRIEGTYTTTGTGSSQPEGIVHAAGTGVTSAVASVITSDELIDLVHSLDPSYRKLSSVGFMFHDSLLKYFRKLKTAEGQYIWVPGISGGAPDTLLDYPVAINQAMTGTTNNLPVTATKHILFGAFEKYVIRDVANQRFYRLDERYRDTDQTAFVSFRRFDSKAINANALKVLLQA